MCDTGLHPICRKSTWRAQSESVRGGSCSSSLESQDSSRRINALCCLCSTCVHIGGMSGCASGIEGCRTHPGASHRSGSRKGRTPGYFGKLEAKLTGETQRTNNSHAMPLRPAFASDPFDPLEHRSSCPLLDRSNCSSSPRFGPSCSRMPLSILSEIPNLNRPKRCIADPTASL